MMRVQEIGNYRSSNEEPTTTPVLDKPWSSNRRLTHGNKLFFLGSCFSENIALEMKQLGFTTHSNPWGILFNPLAIAHCLKGLVAQKAFTESDVDVDLTRKDDPLVFSYQLSTKYSAEDTDTLLSKINKSSNEASLHLSEATVCFVTLGTSKCYFLQQQDSDRKVVVANCHRQPSTHFTSRCIDATEVVEALADAVSDVLRYNNKIQIVLTVSPVRHSKDGMVENSRSKATLVCAAHILAGWLVPPLSRNKEGNRIIRIESNIPFAPTSFHPSFHPPTYASHRDVSCLCVVLPKLRVYDRRAARLPLVCMNVIRQYYFYTNKIRNPPQVRRRHDSPIPQRQEIHPAKGFRQVSYPRNYWCVHRGCQDKQEYKSQTFFWTVAVLPNSRRNHSQTHSEYKTTISICWLENAGWVGGSETKKRQRKHDRVTDLTKKMCIKLFTFPNLTERRNHGWRVMLWIIVNQLHKGRWWKQKLSDTELAV